MVRTAASTGASVPPAGSAGAHPPLVKLAAYVAAEQQPAGDATLVERKTGSPGQASINVWDLYTDDGRYFFSQTEAGLRHRSRTTTTRAMASSDGRSPRRPPQ